MITLKEIKDYYSNIGPCDKHPVLYCDYCCTEYSSTPGDYWMVTDDHEFRCSYCKGRTEGNPLRLVVKRTVYDDVV